MNLVSKDYHDHKSFCEDLTEGKFSFPNKHGIQSKTHDNRLLNILKQRTEDVDVKKHAVEYLYKIGSMKYTYDMENIYCFLIISEMSLPNCIM